MTALLILLSAIAAHAQQPAFPGAEGYGMYTTGGRGGDVLHVTNLNDAGEGSLRWACQQRGPRTIVFDVSGTIMLQSELKVRNGDITIAGQTAPGDGICVANYPFVIACNNIIVRYMRFRLGNEALKQNPNAHEGDGLGGMDAENIIIDHCSVSWSIDECLSVYGSRNTTVQWCIAAQSLQNAGHSKGSHGYGGNWGGAGASYHHNLMAHHVSRTPRLGPRPGTQTDERMDMRCNVIYNWIDNGVYGGEGMHVNIVNNYYKPGPDTKTGAKGMRIAAPGIRTSEYTHHDSDTPNQWDLMWHVWGKYYVSGNVNSRYTEVTADNWTYGIYNQIDNAAVDYTFTAATRDTMRLSEPIAFVSTTTHSAEQALERVTQYAGASLCRDAIDQTMADDARHGTTTYTGQGCKRGIINSPDDLRPDAAGDDWTPWPLLHTLPAPQDTDRDGMPDTWETQHGLNPADPTDGRTYAPTGYTWTEEYINSLVSHITDAQNEGGILLTGQQTSGLQPVAAVATPRANATYTLDGRTATPARRGVVVSKGRKHVRR
ncbi:MAG: pectate lyase [Prevotella sp.]|nr:pectate lyase [Prevotella sp.]